MAAKERDKSKPIWDNAKVKFLIAIRWCPRNFGENWPTGDLDFFKTFVSGGTRSRKSFAISIYSLLQNISSIFHRFCLFCHDSISIIFANDFFFDIGYTGIGYLFIKFCKIANRRVIEDTCGKGRCALYCIRRISWNEQYRWPESDWTWLVFQQTLVSY